MLAEAKLTLLDRLPALLAFVLPKTSNDRHRYVANLDPGALAGSPKQ